MDLKDLVRNTQKCDELLAALDEIATDVDAFEYGFPMHDEGAKARMREAIYQWACSEPAVEG